MYVLSMGKFVTCQCPKCHEVFKQESKFRQHMLMTHDITADQLRDLYIEFMCDNVEPRCQCSPDCRQPLRWKDWKHGFVSNYARGHNARVDSCWFSHEKQQEMANKRRLGFEEGKYTPWNKGLTRITDNRIDESTEKARQTILSGYRMGNLRSYRSDPERGAAASQKQSETMKRRYREEEIRPWNKGLNKFIDERIQQSAESIRQCRLTSDDIGRLTTEQIKTIIDQTGVFDPPSVFRYQNKYTKINVVCKECGNVSQKSVTMLINTPVCFYCHPKESVGQLQIFEFIRSLTDDVVLSDRSVLSGRELDIYVPSKKFAIEYNGLYYHSVECLHDASTYHEEKTKASAAAGVRLFHVFEDEWRDKRPIVESMVRNALGLSFRGPGARQCELVELDVDRRREFFNTNHMDGDARSEVCFGLIKDGIVWSAISLRRPFHKSKWSRLEVSRFASRLQYTVPGALGRLTKVALEYAHRTDRIGLLSYVDTRHGTGAAYEKVGYQDVGGKLTPRFWWTDFKNRFNRFKYKADKLRGLTQSQVAQQAGVVMIWGCSNRVMACD